MRQRHRQRQRRRNGTHTGRQKLRWERWGYRGTQNDKMTETEGYRKQEREKETGRKESRKQTELQYDKDRWQERV